MSDSGTIIGALSGAITITIAFFLFYYHWRSYVIDVTRQQLFELRDRLFDMACRGELDRSSETYKVIREMFNSSLRFIHRIGLFQFLAVMLWNGKEIRENAVAASKVIANIEDESVREEVQRLVDRMSAYMFLQLVKRSAISIVALPVILLLYVVVTLGFQSFDNFRRRNSEVVEGLAYREAAKQAVSG